MSDISANSSFELISDSDHSDVDESSVVSHQLDHCIQNTDQSSEVDSKVLEPEVPEVFTTGKKTSPAMNTWAADRSGSSFEKIIDSNHSNVDKASVVSDQSNDHTRNKDDSSEVEPKMVKEMSKVNQTSDHSISSFEQTIDSNRSDIDEPSIESHNLANDFPNTNNSDEADLKIVKAEALEDLTGEKLTAPKKSTPNRRQSNHSYAVDPLLAALSIFLLCFIVFGGYVLLFNRTIVKKCNVTMEYEEKAYNFPQQKKQELIDRAMKIGELRKIIQGKTRFTQLPENLWDKFIPDLSRFEGVDEFLQQTQTNGTVVEDYLYFTTPTFYLDKGRTHVKFIFMDTSEQANKFRIEDCNFSGSCHKYYDTLKNENLYIRETFILNSHQYEFTRVYFIPYDAMV